MAVVSSVVVRSDGWSADVTIAGWAGEQGNITYDFDANGTPKFVMTVTSEGYDSSGVLGTVTREVYGTTAVRLPYPNEAQLDETDSGSDIVIRVALSDHVYNDDKNGGAGTSGVDPTVSITAGCFEITADPTATFSGTATNNSTLDYPKVIGQWDLETTPMFDRVQADFEIGFIAYHGFQVAAVALSAIGASSSHTQSGDVSAPSVTDHPVSGLSSESFKLSVPVAGYTQGENITLRAVAYPKVGDADSIRDTATKAGGFADYYKGDAEITCTCDKDNSLAVYGVVDPAGNDGTGVTSATLTTAEASPYLTIAAAITGGANVVYLNDGSYNTLGGNPADNGFSYWTEIREHPSATSVTINRGGNRTYNNTRLAWIGLTINGTDFLDGGNGNKILKFQNCSMDNSGSITVGLGYRNQGTWFIGCTYANGTDNSEFAQFSSVNMMYQFTGCNIASVFVTTIASSVVGTLANGNNSTDGCYVSINGSATGGLQFGSNRFVSHSRLVNTRPSAQRIVAFSGQADDCAVVGTVMEVRSQGGSQPAFWVFADGSTDPVSNFICQGNTVVGQRVNFCYNDTGTAAVLRTNVFLSGNAFEQYNIKADTFAVSPDGNRVGNWAQEYGVGYKDNRAGGSASAAFQGDYFGLNGVNNGTAGGDGSYLGFVDNASQSGSGLGNGDYTPDTGSPLLGHTLIRPIALFDLNGNSVGSEIGAVSLAAAPSNTGTARGRMSPMLGRLNALGVIN